MDRIWEKSYPQDIDYKSEIQPCLIHEVFEEAAADFPDHAFMDFLGRKFTYGDSLKIVDRLAAGLQKLGVKKGVHVGLFLPNTPAYPLYCFAIHKAGGTVVNFNVLDAIEEVHNQAEDSEIEFIVTHDLKMLTEKVFPLVGRGRLKNVIVCPLTDFMPFLKKYLVKVFKRGLFASIPDEDWIVHHESVLGDPSHFAPPSISVDDVALIQYTGGTTGRSKGALLTHGNITVNGQTGARFYEPVLNRGQCRHLAVLPFFHIFGFTGGLITLTYLAAEHVFIFPRFEVNEAIKLIKQHKVNFLAGVPTMYYALANHKDAKEALESVKVCVSGGDTLPPKTRKAFEEVCSAQIGEGYGLTETSPIATVTPPTGIAKDKSCGLPAIGVEVGILDLQSRTKFLGVGEKGEICVRGPSVMKGYFKRPDATKNVMHGDWLRTGDIGYMDEDGYLFLIDREKDLVIVSGHNVYPRHVQEEIAKHESVAEVAAVGVPDEYQQEHMKAFIVAKRNRKLTKDEILKFLEPKLSSFEMPKEIEFRSELPKTLIGKISKKQLREEEIKKMRKKGSLV